MSWIVDVEKEYEKDEKLKKEDVDSLRLWADKQGHLPKITGEWMEISMILELNPFVMKKVVICTKLIQSLSNTTEYCTSEPRWEVCKRLNRFKWV